MSKNNDYTTGNLLDFAYFKKTLQFNCNHLSKKTKLKDPQQINFIWKTFKKYWSNNFFHYQKIRRNYFQFFTKFCHNHINNGNRKDCKFAKWF